MITNQVFALIVALGHAFKRWLRPACSAAALVAGATGDLTRTRSELLTENALLRQQLIVLRRCIQRPRLHRDDRLLFVILARMTRRWRDALHLFQPETLLRWHRDLFRTVWRWKSRSRARPMRLTSETIELIQAMGSSNVLWGAERSRGELRKLSIRVSKRTIQKYMRRVRPPGNRGQTWGTFLRNHSEDIWACDFLQLHDMFFRPIFAFFFVVHGTREAVHFNVTRSPTDAWTAQQLRKATPYCDAPRYLPRDNDDKFGRNFAAVAAGTGIEIVRIPPRSPNLNPICERFLGTVRRKGLDHIVILSERQLRRVLTEYVEAYFNHVRPHQGIGQKVPSAVGNPAPAMVTPTNANVAALPILGGLHHSS